MFNKIKSYRARCTSCSRDIELTDQPHQPPCICGSHTAVYKGQLVAIVWAAEDNKQQLIRKVS